MYAFGPLNLGLPTDQVKKVVDDALKVVGMSEFTDRPPHFLSLWKKRVALAGVLAMQPEVIIMDEPTSNLDPRAASDILHLLLQLNKESGITLLLARYHVDMVPLFANKLYILNKGKLVSEGEPKKIFSNTELIRKVNLRSPRLTHLFEVLRKKTNLPIAEEFPLTIGEARKEILRLLQEKEMKTT